MRPERGEDMLIDQIERSDPSFVEANGIRLCYESFGSRRDPPLVLIMGLAAQMIVWPEDFCRELAAQGRFVVRFDNRDIGKSTYLEAETPPSIGAVFGGLAGGSPPAAPYTLVDMARDTVGLLDALDIGRADVVGASMGGAIAQELAVHYPERLRTMTLIFAPSGDPDSPPPSPAAFANLVKPRPTERSAFVEMYVESWRVLNADHFPFDEPRVRWEAETSFDRGRNPAGIVRQMMAIVASGNRKEALRATKTPALVLHGTRDPLVPFAIGEDLAATIPGAAFEPIEGMGHNLPRGAWPQILRAIGRHAPVSGAAADGG
jgi:pimeloyl-ACP methyl ester carboxylesterase